MRLFDKKTGSLVVMFFGEPIDKQIETSAILNIESCVQYSYNQKDNIKTAVDFVKYCMAVIGQIGKNAAKILEATLAQMLDPEHYEKSDYFYGVSDEGEFVHASVADKLNIKIVERDSDYTSRCEAIFYQKSDPKITSVQAEDRRFCLAFSVVTFLKYIQTAFSDDDLQEILYHVNAMLSLEFGIPAT